MEFAADDKYIRPKIADELMKAAQSIARTVYIYGAAGYGKTSFAADFLARKKVEYYSASSDALYSVAVEKTASPRTVVVDDLHLILSPEKRERLYTVLDRLSTDSGVWLILISRAPLAAWLRPLCIHSVFMMIGEAELSLSEPEQEAYLRNWELDLTPQSVQYLRKLSGGCPLPLRIAAMELASLSLHGLSTEERRKKEFSAIEKARKDFWDYLQTEVFSWWDSDLQEFLMNLSVVDSFDLTMARQITKRNDAGRLLLMAQEAGNFLLERAESGHTMYELRSPLRLAMKKRLTECCTQSHIDTLYYSAGAGFELLDRIPEALEMYEKCCNEEGISRLLIANARKHAGSGRYWELRRYYFALSEETIRHSPELMAGMSLLQSIATNDEESERWYKTLSAYVKSQTGGAKKNAQARLFYLEIALPQRGTARMTDLLKQAWTFVSEKQAVLPELSLTNNQPTIMHGGKDFCEWSKRDRELARTIGKPVERLLGSFGKGLVHLALAESFFEKGSDDPEVQIHAQKGWMQALSGGRAELAFVAVGLLAWQAVLGNRMQEALESLESFRTSAVEDALQLLSGIDTLKMRFLLYMGRGSDMPDWLPQTPDENAEFCTLERYRYSAKVRVYLSEGQKEKALALLERLMIYAEKRQRTYLLIECGILLSIAQFRLGDKNWQTTLQKVISAAEGYHFVRVLSREGAALYPLLKAGDFLWQDEGFKKQVLKECMHMAQLYPVYLSERSTGSVTLSDRALMVLRRQEEGKSVVQIAEELYISKSGVKYYIQDTYKKLGVNSKTAAIHEARRRKLL